MELGLPFLIRVTFNYIMVLFGQMNNMNMTLTKAENTRFA